MESLVSHNKNIGKAKRLFIETEGSAPWKPFSPVEVERSWPLLESLLEQGGLSYLDLTLAEYILRHHSECDEAIAVFICHLSICAREGHLCVRVKDQVVEPDPSTSWRQEAEVVENQCDFDQIRNMIIDGAKHLPNDVYQPKIAPIRKEGDLYYIQKNWQYEQDVVRFFMERLKTTPEVELDTEKSDALVQEMEDAKRLLPEQASAIRSACRHSFGIISGGPGTGKTYTAGLLIKVFWECLPDEKRDCFKIALAAPTGKAAANLHKSLLAATKEIPELASLQAKTLHALLGIRSKSHATPNMLNADLILVDESSMIDVRMMGFLLCAVKAGARLIMLGDPYQLPPVEAGALFGDMIAYLDKIPEKAATKLKTCLRADLKEIVDFAKSVNDGKADEALELLHSNEHVAICSSKSSKKMLQDAMKRFPFQWDGHTPPTSFMETYNRYRLLSPLRRGEMGVEAVNKWFLTRLKRSVPQGGWFVAPIMIVQNDYKMGLFNGEVGVLFTKQQGGHLFQKGDFALFTNKSTQLPALLLPKFEYAYCLSVHKSQGSEFDEVMLLMPEGSEIFGREVLYTAVTRARKKLKIYGSEEVIRETIKLRSHRLSGFSLLGT